jgi:hypothetical protein
LLQGECTSLKHARLGSCMPKCHLATTLRR